MSFDIIKNPPFFLYPLIALVLCISLLGHELGHIVAGRMFGLPFASLKLTLSHFCRINLAVQLPGVYTLRPSQRELVALSGPMMNFLLAELFAALLLVFKADTNILLFSFYGATLNFAFCISNLVPFFDSDGFHFVSSRFFHSLHIRKELFACFNKGVFNSEKRIRRYFFLYLFECLAVCSVSSSITLMFLKTIGILKPGSIYSLLTVGVIAVYFLFGVRKIFKVILIRKKGRSMA